MHNLFVLPNGRGSILRAIAAGYLERQPSDLDNWARIIAIRLIGEHHPDVWAVTMMHTPMLFNNDTESATRLYDSVIRAYPQVLENKVALYSVARVMSRCRPKEHLQAWLEKIAACSTAFSRQAYGEMLFLYHCHYQDSWSEERVTQSLTVGAGNDLLLGLAYGASNLWESTKCRTTAREILCLLASSDDKSIHHAVADVFHCSHDDFQLNAHMKEVIQAVCRNRPLLLEAAPNLVELLIDYTGIEPQLVPEVCQEIIQAGGSDIGNISTSLALLAEHLTNITLTLHRHPEYREVGLRLFEDLISLNVRETRTALELLDRKPIKTTNSPTRPRRRRKRSSKG